jgi:hypothetical protein
MSIEVPYVKFWPSQICIDFSTKVALQKWGYRFKQQNNFKKIPHQECHTSNPFQHTLSKNNNNNCLQSNLEGSLDFKFQIL